MKNFFLLSLLALQITHIAATQEKCEICMGTDTRFFTKNVWLPNDKTYINGWENANIGFACAVTALAIFDAIRFSRQNQLALQAPDGQMDPTLQPLVAASFLLNILNIMNLIIETVIPQNDQKSIGQLINAGSFSCTNALTPGQTHYFAFSKQQYDQLLNRLQEGVLKNSLNGIAFAFLSTALTVVPLMALIWKKEAAKSLSVGFFITAFGAFLSKFVFFEKVKNAYDDAESILDSAVETRNCTTTP